MSKGFTEDMLEDIRRLPDRLQVARLRELVESGVLSPARLTEITEREIARDLERERESVYPGLAERLAEDGWQKTKRPVYLRFGELPEGGRSTTEVAELWEDGISVFSARLTKAGHYVVFPSVAKSSPFTALPSSSSSPTTTAGLPARAATARRPKTCCAPSSTNTTRLTS